MPRTLHWLLVASLAGAISAATYQGDVVISDPARLDPRVTACVEKPSEPMPPSRDAEVHAARSPRDMQHVVAAWQMLGGRSGVIQASTSADGGLHWSAPRALAITACAGGPPRARYASDSWVAVGPDGRAYVAAIGFSGGDDSASFSALMVATSPDGGRTWEPAAPAAIAGVSVQFDNVSIAANPHRAGHAYLATTRYSPLADSTGGRMMSGRIGFTKSVDGGATWSPLAIISPAIARGRVSAPQLVADGADGVLRVFYFRSEPGRTLFGYQESRDEGATWSDERLIAPSVPAKWELDSITRNSFILAGDILSVATDQKSGVLYVAYPDGRRDPDGRLGVSLVGSFDHGATWSAPVSVSPDSTETAWLPSVAIAPDGRVAVAYLTADFSRRAETVITAHVRAMSVAGRRLVAGKDLVRARSPVAWPGDYHALLALRDGFRLITVRGNAGSAANPTDVVMH